MKENVLYLVDVGEDPVLVNCLPAEVSLSKTPSSSRLKGHCSLTEPDESKQDPKKDLWRLKHLYNLTWHLII